MKTYVTRRLTVDVVEQTDDFVIVQDTTTGKAKAFSPEDFEWLFREPTARDYHEASL